MEYSACIGIFGADVPPWLRFPIVLYGGHESAAFAGKLSTGAFRSNGKRRQHYLKIDVVGVGMEEVSMSSELLSGEGHARKGSVNTSDFLINTVPVSYTHLTLPTTPYV